MQTTSRTGALTPVRFAMSVKTAGQVGKVSQVELARYLDLSRDAIAKRLSGKIRWNLDEVYAIAHLFGVDPGSMVNGSGEWLNDIEPSAVRGRLDKTAGQGLIVDTSGNGHFARSNSHTAIAERWAV